MRTLNYNIILIVFMLIALNCRAGEEYEKKFHESYPVNKETLFEISNKFGTIKIENTNENEITIDAEIVIDNCSESQAEKVFEQVQIEINKTGNIVTAKTIFDNLSTNNLSLSINYYVTMPKYLAINLSNKYGSVNINQLEGKSNLIVKYGSLEVNSIADGNSKPLSSVTLEYCDKNLIKEFNWGSLILRYSKAEVLSGKALVISSKYSKVKLGQFSSIVAEASYDDYQIGTANNVVIESKYTDIKAIEIAKKINIENKYGKIAITTIPIDFISIDIMSKYSSVMIGISDQASYSLDASVSYADLKYNKLNITQRIKENTSITLKGYAGNKDSKSTVKIESSYGNVDLRP